MFSSLRFRSLMSWATFFIACKAASTFLKSLGQKRQKCAANWSPQRPLHVKLSPLSGLYTMATASPIRYLVSLLHNWWVEQLNSLLMYILPYSSRDQGGGLALPKLFPSAQSSTHYSATGTHTIFSWLADGMQSLGQLPSPPCTLYLCWGCVYLSSSANWRGYLQIFCTGVSRKPSREMSIILCSSRQASKKYTYLLSLVSRESSTQALGWLLQYSE